MTPLRSACSKTCRYGICPRSPNARIRSTSPASRVTSASRPRDWAPKRFGRTKVYLTNEKQLAPASIVITVAALRFLYMVTLQKPWTVAVVIPAPKRPQTLPVILSRAEVVARR